MCCLLEISFGSRSSQLELSYRELNQFLNIHWHSHTSLHCLPLSSWRLSHYSNRSLSLPGLTNRLLAYIGRWELIAWSCDGKLNVMARKGSWDVQVTSSTQLLCSLWIPSFSDFWSFFLTSASLLFTLLETLALRLYPCSSTFIFLSLFSLILSIIEIVLALNFVRLFEKQSLYFLFNSHRICWIPLQSSI